MFFLDILRFEARLQWRSLRFRVGTIIYLLIACAPPVVLATVIQPQAPHEFGAASYLGWSLDLSRFLTLILAMVVAGNRVDESSQRQLWPVLAPAGVGNGGYLWRRWAAMGVLLSVIAAIPPFFAFLLSTALGLPLYDPVGYVGPWLLLLVSAALMQSALWLALVTIAGSELGALMLFYLFNLSTTYLSDKLQDWTGSTFGPNNEWLGWYQLRWGLSGLLDLGENKWTYGQQLKSEAAFDLAQLIDWWLARALPHLAFAFLMLTLAIGFVRRTRGDVRPLVLRENHPLRNLLRFIHAARARYTPDAALGGELWRVVLALLLVAGAFLTHHRRQTYFEDRAELQYATEIETENQPSTPPDLLPTKRSIEGEIHDDGSLETTSVVHLENKGEEEVDVISFTTNAFLEVEASFADDRAFRLDRRNNRFFLFLEAPITPREAVDLRVTMRGRPRFVHFEMRGSWGASSSFALLYRQHKRGPHPRTDLARSNETRAISNRRIELASSSLTPLFRYTTWELTDPPTVRGDSGLEVLWEEVQPVEDIEIDLRLPPGVLVADVCANASINDSGEPIRRMRGECRTAATSYLLRGGPLEVAASGEVTLFTLPGHEEKALAHLPALEEVIQLSASAWPDLEPVDSLVALELSADMNWGRFARSNMLRWDPTEGWSSAPPRVDGQLMSIFESRLVLDKPISSAELVERILTRRVTEKRAIAPREQQIFRLLIATAMSQRMGLGHEFGAVIAGKPWDKFWAAQPILTEDNRRHLLFNRKVEGIGIELIARTGTTAFYQGVNAFLDSKSESPGTLRELFTLLEEYSNTDLQSFWDQYFTEVKGLPEMRLGKVEVRAVGDAFLVEGEVQNVGTGRARCPVIIKAEGQSRTVFVEVDAESTERFEVRSDRRPLSALLDPERVCYRWVHATSGMVERVALGGVTGEER